MVGPTGPIGATGPTGPAGNANVEGYTFQTISSSWTMTAGVWSATYQGLTISTGYNVQVSMVTSNSTNPKNTAMPYTDPSTGIYYGFSWDLSHIYINVYTVPSSTTIPNPANQTFNITIIPI